MLKFSSILNEHQNINTNTDTLVIVDVQKIFGEYIPIGFDKKLNKYCNNFKYVYQIWDSNKVNKPSFIFNNQIESIEKKYGTKYSEDLLKKISSIESKYDDIKEGDIFEIDSIDTFNDKGPNYIVNINNNHKWFYLNDNIVRLYNKLKGKDIILVGGAGNECIYDVHISMKSFNINPIYNHEYIYSVDNSNNQKVKL
jgi:hypothetical protein